MLNSKQYSSTRIFYETGLGAGTSGTATNTTNTYACLLVDLSENTPGSTARAPNTRVLVTAATRLFCESTSTSGMPAHPLWKYTRTTSSQTARAAFAKHLFCRIFRSGATSSQTRTALPTHVFSEAHLVGTWGTKNSSKEKQQTHHTNQARETHQHQQPANTH